MKNKLYHLLMVLFFGLFMCPLGQAEQRLHVGDFGAVPDDGRDDAVAIQKALKSVLGQKNVTLAFDAGRYDLIEHPQGRGSFIRVSGFSHLTIQGATDSSGAPTTQLVRHWDPQSPDDASRDHLLLADGCQSLKMENLVFDNSPQFCTAGEVIEKGDSYLVVDVFEGLPRIEGVGNYCSNAWDLDTRLLKRVESITYGEDVKANLREMTWHNEPGGSGRRMRLNSPTVAGRVEVGDGLSWNFGFYGIQVKMKECRDIELNNLLTVNSVGFAMESLDCINIRADRVMVKPTGNQLAVGSRDGWKLYACSGRVEIKNMHQEGVRWDGQNVHGSFTWVDSIEDSRNLVLYKMYTAAPRIFPASEIGFWKDGEFYTRVVDRAESGHGENGRPEFTVRLTEDMPEFVKPGTMASVLSWDIDHYSLQNCTFRNIAGSASILRNRHASFQDCTFERIMYPAICIGASVEEGEGTFPQDVTISRCYFKESGWVDRHGVFGMVAMESGGVDGMLMAQVTIEDCIFENAKLGIHIAETKAVYLLNNTFRDVAIPYEINDETTGGVKFERIATASP